MREGLQMQEFPSGNGPTTAGDEIGVVLFPLAPIPAGADPVVPVQWSDRALWSVAPGTTTGVQVRPVVGTSGALRNVGGSTVSLTITLSPPGTVLNVNLAPFQRIALPAWTSAVAANVHWTIRNNSSTATALLSLDGRFDFAPNLSGTPAPVFRASLTPDTRPQRHGWHFGERNIGTTPTFPVLVAAEDRANGFRYLPPIRIESFTVNRTPLNDGVVILYSSLPAGSTAFYQSYDIEMSLTLSPPAWTRVATAPANYQGSHALYQDVFIPAPSRFFRVVENAQP